jgi:outer membrane protein TolC
MFNKFSRKLMKKLILLTILLISSLAVSAQIKVYTLEDAIRTGLENNYDIKQAVLEIEKARAAVREAYGYAMPSVDLSAGFNHFVEKPKMAFPDFRAMLTNATYGVLFDEGLLPRDNSKFLPMKTTLQSFSQANSYETKIQVSQILFNSTVFEGIGASGTYLQTSKVALKSSIVSKITEIKKNFYSVILTKKLLEITRESFENAKRNLSNVQALRQQGLVSEFDALTAEVRVENIRPAVLQMENALKLAKEGLKISMAIPQSQEIDVEGEIDYDDSDILPEQTAIEQAMKSNYDLLTLENLRRVNNAYVEISRSEYWPSLVAFGNYSFNGSSDNLNFNNYRSAIVGLSFSINLFNGMRTTNKVQQSLIEVEKTDYQIMQLRQAISIQVKSKINDLARIKSNIEAQERNVNLAQRGYEIATTRYREGTGSQLEIENADLALRQAKTNLLQSYYDWTIAKNELEALLGNINSRYFTIYSKYIDEN